MQQAPPSSVPEAPVRTVPQRPRSSVPEAPSSSVPEPPVSTAGRAAARPYPVAVPPVDELIRARPAPDPSRATLRRSVELLRAFWVEQTDPDRFYGTLALDSVRQVGRYAPLAGATVLDVGGGPGYFAAEFARAGARYLAVDSDVGEVAARGRPGPGTVVGS